MNDSGETQQSGKWVLAAVGGSLLLHGLMMLVPYSQEPMSDDPGRTIRLVSQPEPATSPEPPPRQEPMDEPPEPDPTPEPVPARPMVRPIVTIPTPAPQETAEEPLDSDAPVESFSQLVLASVRQLHGDIEIPKGRDILEAHPVPTLPDQPGWLNDYVGTVEPGIDRWQNGDGTRESRIVLANGQVICGRARAPTPGEIFNPQFALNIMAFRPCGRERPEPVDRTDPWFRGGPGVDGE